MRQPTLSIVIPNYNGAELLKKNLPQVFAACGDAEIIIVDDASTDGSVAMLHKAFPRVRVITRKTNEGFSSAVNAGVSAANHDLVMLLNSDAYPIRGFFHTVLPHFDDANVFAVGLAQECKEDGKTVIRGRGLGKFLHGFLIHRYADPTKEITLWVSGGAGVFRKSIWMKLGGMQELYNPFYWEDIDLSYRAMKAGYRILFEPNVRLIHRQSIGSIRKGFTEDRIKMIAYRNQFFFVWLNITDSEYLFQHFVWFPYHVIKAFIFRDWTFLQALMAAVVQLPVVLKERGNNEKLWKNSDKVVFASL